MPLTSPTRTLLAGALLTATALIATPASAAPRTPDYDGLLLAEAVATLPTGSEQRDGYQRSSFRHWVDADRDGCSTRAEVLIEEAIAPPQVGDGCRLTGGKWYSYYDDLIVEDPAGLDVDHLVPLAEAWDSGAHAWGAAKRQEYANDLVDSWHLVAVTARSNRQKSDQDPSTWQPPYEVARCRYAAEWTAIKLRWELNIDPAEREALTDLGRACPDQRLPTSAANQR